MREKRAKHDVVEVAPYGEPGAKRTGFLSLRLQFVRNGSDAFSGKANPMTAVSSGRRLLLCPEECRASSPRASSAA